MFTDSTLKTETVNSERLYTFRPNTITYAIPVDHPIGKAAAAAKIGVVFHTHYTGDELASMQARAGADIESSRDALVIKNDTPMNRVGFSKVMLRCRKSWQRSKQFPTE